MADPCYEDIKFDATPFGACPRCGSDSKILWGWAGEYYDMMCKSGHNWTYDFKKETKTAFNEKSLYLFAVKAAKEKSQNQPGYFSGGFDIMKKLYEQQSGRKLKEAPGYYTGGYGIVRKWQREHGTSPSKTKPTSFQGGFSIVKEWQKEHGKSQK